MAEKEETGIAVFNQGQRTYQTSVGDLHPKQSITLPEKEAQNLMTYRDVVDMSKVAPKASEKMKRLEKENADLKEQIASHASKKADVETDPEESDKKDSGKGGKKGHK